MKVSLQRLASGGHFIGRCGWKGSPSSGALLLFQASRIPRVVPIDLRPGQGARWKGLLERLGPGLFFVGQPRLGAGQHHQGALDEALAGQAPALGSAPELLALDGGEGAEGVGLGVPHIHKAGDALATPPAIAKPALQSVELNPLAQSHFSQIFPREALHIAPLAQETNHGHGPSRNGG